MARALPSVPTVSAIETAVRSGSTAGGGGASLAFGAALGTGTSDGSSATTLTFNTSASVPAGGRAIVVVSQYGSLTPTLTIGGVSATRDATFARTSDASYKLHVFSLHSAGGIASASAVTATWGGGTFGRQAFAFYATGIASASAVDVVSGSGNTTGFPWASAAASTANANDFLVGCANIDFISSSSTPSGSFTEVYDVVSANATFVVEYRIVSSTGSYQASGTWADPGSQEWLAGMVAYKAG